MVKKYVALALGIVLAVSMVVAGAPEQVYRTVYSGEVTTLNYLTTSSTNEFGLAANFIDTLVEYDELGVIKPALATSWSVSPDGLVWTFNIREGVHWYDHRGNAVAEVVAQDWVDSLKYVFSPENASATANIAYNVIKNGKAYYDGTITDFGQVGVKAKDKYTLEFTLETPVPYFLSMLDYSVFMPANGDFLAAQGRRFGTDNTRLLYNGAYILTTFEHQNRRVLTKNENYWDRDNVHIEQLVFQYNAEAATIAPALYLNGEISSVSHSLDHHRRVDDPPKGMRDMVRPHSAQFLLVLLLLELRSGYSMRTTVRTTGGYTVNNLDFRKSLFHGLNRLAAMATSKPSSPGNDCPSAGYTPAGFADVTGKDYTSFGNLARFAYTESFNAELALGVPGEGHGRTGRSSDVPGESRHALQHRAVPNGNSVSRSLSSKWKGC